MKKILVTGGAGFIGSNLVKYLIDKKKCNVMVIDKLTYASSLESLKLLKNIKNFSFKKIDICKEFELEKIFKEFKPEYIMHLAAESHVDNSIKNSRNFVQTNVMGTYNLLNISLKYWHSLDKKYSNKFRFLHVSTDEVYGSLKLKDKLFTEKNPYLPNSPYSASKAGSDHLVRSWNKTYNFPSIITNCSNNYGPFQHPEKFIPVVIINALKKRKIPIYGNGFQIRDWIHVDDHVEALYKTLVNGRLGETYNIGSNKEIRNIDLAITICGLIDQIKKNDMYSHSDLITYVEDRKGHDFRYALNSKKIKKELQWAPKVKFSEGLKKTVMWYNKNHLWIDHFNNKKKKFIK